MGSRNWLWAIISAGGLIALVMLLADRFPGRLDDAEQRTRLVYLIGVLILVSSGGLAVRLRNQPKNSLFQLGLWVAIFAFLTLGYSFKKEFSQLGARLSGELSPSSGTIGDSGEISFPRSADGHYHVMATINGKRIEFLVDSGATDIVLSPDDAGRLGFDPAQLSFTSMAETANGVVYGAPIMLGEIDVGPIVMVDLPAQVNRADMTYSLLGMEFLNRLQSWKVENDKLTLKK